MRTVVAGCRDGIPYEVVENAIKTASFKITTIISGGARGVDSHGERFAKENKIPLEKFLADWDKYGLAAGPIRNEEMAKNAEAAIIVWDFKSKGTKHMVSMARKYKLKLLVVGYNPQKFEIQILA